MFSYPLFKLLFTEEYIKGYIIAPYLFLAPLLQMLFQVACNQFLVIKKTWPNMLILFLGALANVGINYILIPIIGIEGAAIATLIGYAISDSICVIVLKKMKLMIISKRFLKVSLIIVAYIIVWRFLFNTNFILGFLIATSITSIFIIFYKEDLMILVKSKKNKI